MEKSAAIALDESNESLTRVNEDAIQAHSFSSIQKLQKKSPTSVLKWGVSRHETEQHTPSYDHSHNRLYKGNKKTLFETAIFFCVMQKKMLPITQQTIHSPLSLSTYYSIALLLGRLRHREKKRKPCLEHTKQKIESDIPIPKNIYTNTQPPMCSMNINSVLYYYRSTNTSKYYGMRISSSSLPATDSTL